MKLGIFRRPVGKSKSPVLFKALGKMIGRKINYVAVGVKKGGFEGAVEIALKKGWRGANVTIPFKLEAANYATRLTDAARVIGAVNVLRFDDHEVVGHNTDGDGLRDSLKRAGVRMSGKRVLVFGAGGAARAAGWALAKSGARTVHFTNRTAATAKICARELAPSFPKTRFSAGAPKNADIWINATPLGQTGNPDKSPADSKLRAPETAVDLVYGKQTAFQKHGERLGAFVMDGTAMLVFQALRGWEFWDKPLAGRRAALAERLIEEIS